MFEEAKALVPQLFDFLEQPGTYLKEFLSLVYSQKSQQRNLQNLDAYHSLVNSSFDRILQEFRKTGLRFHNQETSENFLSGKKAERNEMPKLTQSVQQ